MVEGPRVLAFEVTRKCRFKCVHCRANAGEAGERSPLTTEQCRRILDSVASYCKCLIIWTGGEPLERADIYELISHARGLGLTNALATCGYLIDKASAARLKEAGINAISFSLDGATAATHDKFRQTAGAFDAVIRAAGVVRATGIRFQVNTTITRGNVGEIDRIAQLAVSLGATCFNPFVLVPTGRAQEIAGEVLSPSEYNAVLAHLLELKKALPIELRVTCGPQFARLSMQENKDAAVKGCLGGKAFGFISYRGDVQICGFLDICAGNVVENGYDFGSIWRDSEFLGKIRDHAKYEGNCGICEYTRVCGGCRARAYGMLGESLASDPICDYAPIKGKGQKAKGKSEESNCVG